MFQNVHFVKGHVLFIDMYVVVGVIGRYYTNHVIFHRNFMIRTLYDICSTLINNIYGPGLHGPI